MSTSRPAPVVPLRPPPPLEERDDDALMALAASEYRPAFEMLAGRYLHRLVSYCAKFLGDTSAGEEVAQDVLLEAWRQRARYEGRGRLRVLLFTIARHRCGNRARDDGRRRRLPCLDGGEPVVGNPDSGEELDHLLESERRRRVREALTSLPVKLREAVLLRFDQGLRYAEIARIVHRPEVTVRSRVFNALRRLRGELGEDPP